jgi:hypothetical protein
MCSVLTSIFIVHHGGEGWGKVGEVCVLLSCVNFV